MRTPGGDRAGVKHSKGAATDSVAREDKTHLGQARRFIDVLAGQRPVTFQTFSDRDELKVRRPDGKLYDLNAHIFHGTFEAYELHLMRLNVRGVGVFVMVNAGDGKGRSARNVVRVRVLCIDTDGVPFPTWLPLKSTLR